MNGPASNHLPQIPASKFRRRATAPQHVHTVSFPIEDVSLQPVGDLLEPLALQFDGRPRH